MAYSHYLITNKHEAIGVNALNEIDAYHRASLMGIGEIVIRVDVAMTQEEWDAATAKSEAPEVLAAPTESRPYTWSELTDEEQHEARQRGFATGADIRYICKTTYKDGEHALVRWERAAGSPEDLKKIEYAAGYQAFSEDPDGSIAAAVRDHFSGKMRLDSARYSEAWFNGYQDATDDFSNSQEGF